MSPFIPPKAFEIKRKNEKRVFIGDSALLELSPDTIITMMSGDPPPGRGLHPLSSIPFGLAVDAAIQACGKGITGMDVLKAAEVSLPAKLVKEEPMFACGVVKKIGNRNVECSAEIYQVTNGVKITIMQAKVILVRVVNGKASETLLTGFKLSDNP